MEKLRSLPRPFVKFSTGLNVIPLVKKKKKSEWRAGNIQLTSQIHYIESIWPVEKQRFFFERTGNLKRGLILNSRVHLYHCKTLLFVQQFTELSFVIGD